MNAVLVVLLLAVFVIPAVLDAPVKRRRRNGIDVWDEMWARGELSSEELMKLRDAQGRWGLDDRRTR